ncbi:hypothetical protein EXVG_00390 [Emiliania huxleyi virus 202]|nr:hypothetical protein EXVG_00390 [Emiliania huxleyi virus 202]AHA54349.1 hypothetical protein EhV18_00303 [Emiliania huxleyi virus 18]AHA55387.1 hypothetical protein EhV156_00292 [Emiliania huxleyi virus 156]
MWVLSRLMYFASVLYTRSSLKDMFSYLWPSTDSNDSTTMTDIPTSPQTQTVSTDTTDLNKDTPLPSPPPTILTPTLWCVCIFENYEDPMDCCGRGSRDRCYNAFSVVRAHTKEEAMLHFVPNQNQKNVHVMAAPYTIGKWMDEDDFFNFERDETVLLGYE